MKTCVLKDDHVVGKPQGGNNFGHYAHVFLQSITRFSTGPVTRLGVGSYFNFVQNLYLLLGVTDGPIDAIERYVCKLYKAPAAPPIDNARHLLFSKCQKAHEALPPSNDALELHIARANLQAKIWFQADTIHMSKVSLEE